METIRTCALMLRNKIFKLLPMRENHDTGLENHLKEYVDNLFINCEGSSNCYPSLSNMNEFIEVKNNLAYLKENCDIPFSKWRSIVLRSTRLMQTIINNNGGA